MILYRWLIGKSVSTLWFLLNVRIGLSCSCTWKSTLFLTSTPFKGFPYAAITILVSSAELSPRYQGQDEACEEKNGNFHYDMDVDMSIHNGTGAIQFEMLNLVSYLF